MGINVFWCCVFGVGEAQDGGQPAATISSHTADLKSASQVIQFNIGITLESRFHVSLCSRSMICTVRELVFEHLQSGRKI